MAYLYLGKIVNTHGIKGELRIKSNFDKKDLAFKVNQTIYIGDNYSKEVITSYRKHKEFDMITLKGYDNINQVLKYLKQEVYIKREDLDLKENEYLLEELVSLKVIENEEELGIVKEIVYNNNYVLLSISSTKDFYIPYNSNFIKKVDLDNKTIIVENTKGLIL